MAKPCKLIDQPLLPFSDEIYRLEQVIEAVLQGQTKSAPIERIADIITAYFVPVVTTFAILTWLIWLSLGLSGVLPANTLKDTVGGWRRSFFLYSRKNKLG